MENRNKIDVFVGAWRAKPSSRATAIDVSFKSFPHQSFPKYFKTLRFIGIDLGFIPYNLFYVIFIFYKSSKQI